jgi:hypothetical protein
MMYFSVIKNGILSFSRNLMELENIMQRDWWKGEREEGKTG